MSVKSADTGGFEKHRRGRRDYVLASGDLHNGVTPESPIGYVRFAGDLFSPGSDHGTSGRSTAGGTFVNGGEVFGPGMEQDGTSHSGPLRRSHTGVTY